MKKWTIFDVELDIIDIAIILGSCLVAACFAVAFAAIILI